MDQRTDVLVIGGGLAGLAAAAVAAREGRRVTLVEARSELGGRARTAEREGFLLNEGAHALSRQGEGLRVLRSLGVSPEGAVPPVKGSTAMLDGRLALLPVGPTSLLRTPLLGWRGKVAIGKLLGRLQRLDATALASVPVDRWIADTLADPAARALLHAIVRLTTYVDDPEHLSAGAALSQVQREIGGGVLYLDGGWQTLVDGLAAAVTGAGGTIVTGAKVEQLERGGPGYVAGLGDEDIVAAAVVVAAGGPGTTAGALAGLAPASARWAREARPSMVASLDVGLGRPWGDGPRFVLGVDRPVYLSVHGPTARLAPPGGTLVSLVKYLGAAPTTDAGEDRAELEAVLDRARPGWRADVMDARFLHRVVAITDVPKAATGGAAGRPGPTVAGCPGLFVAGDWVGPAGMLADATLASGAAAGREAALVARRVEAPV